MGLQLGLHCRPMELRVMVAADDVKRISLLEKTGERVEDQWMTFEHLVQLPDTLRFLGSESELAFFFGHFEACLGPGSDGDGDEIDDVAVQEQKTPLALALCEGR